MCVADLLLIFLIYFIFYFISCHFYQSEIYLIWSNIQFHTEAAER